jgi:hypothetical protein
MLTRAQAFERLRSNLELTGLQERAVAERQNSLRAAIGGELAVVDDFLIGSYRRKTLIGPLNNADVDMMVVLDRMYRDRGPGGVLTLLRDVLAREYPRTRISQNGQAVTVSFSDFAIDVVPAFRFPWWDLREGWQICDSTADSWISTDPQAHEAKSARGNQVHDGNLVPWIKQLKAWNRMHGAPLRSFHLETLAWSVFGTSSWWYETFRTDWDAVTYFFRKAPSRLVPPGPFSDRAPAGWAYLTGEKRRVAVSKIRSAYGRCRRAEAAAADGELVAMHDAYREIFGDWYPS